jgi:hypothetical protein
MKDFPEKTRESVNFPGKSGRKKEEKLEEEDVNSVNETRRSD